MTNSGKTMPSSSRSSSSSRSRDGGGLENSNDGGTGRDNHSDETTAPCSQARESATAAGLHLNAAAALTDRVQSGGSDTNAAVLAPHRAGQSGSGYGRRFAESGSGKGMGARRVSMPPPPAVSPVPVPSPTCGGSSALAQCLESKTGGTLRAGIYGGVPDKVCVYEGVRVCMCG